MSLGRMETLNLGCGEEPMDGAVNHDRIAFAGHIDVAWDLNQRLWPWADAQFDRIIAIDVLEHLTDFLGTMNECWRILQPGGVMDLRVPRWDSEIVHIDPTHVRGYHPQNFDYLDPDTMRGQRRWWYTEYKWRIIRVDPNADRGNNITARLEVRK